MEINEKIEALRALLRKNNLAAYIINGTDPHNSEYVCEHWRSREFISGFTGSAGTVLVTLTDALIWVDSRYFVQCSQQIENTCFKMKKANGPEAEKFIDYIKNTFTNNEKIGISAETLMLKQKREFEENSINIVPCDDLLGFIWTDRPPVPETQAEYIPLGISGESTKSKLAKMRLFMKEKCAQYLLVTALDDIAWILNLRANDIPDTPVFLSYLLINSEEAMLFTSENRFKNIKSKCIECRILPYESIFDKLSGISGCSVYVNPENTNMKVINALSGENIIIVEGKDYSTDLKACKNNIELNGMRVAHILDGVALADFMGAVRSNEYSFTEISIAQCLEDERAKEEAYLGPSFSTIAGFADHGAIVHYSATPQTDRKISGSGLLVLDSGGQYVCGTTDVTRTLLFGRATKEMKDNYTRVLKGHLEIASLVFPEGTTGVHIDVLAHRYLWQVGLDYFHGTGHGVGCRLSVHEGPQRISSSLKSDVPLKEGMVLSDEPGVYKEGKFGIRIENLLAVVPAFKTQAGQFYTFEVLTCCPYERRLIDKTLLTEEEINLIDVYHSWVYSQLKDFVSKQGLEYLKEATEPL